MSSSSKNIFPPNQGQLFDQQNGIMTPPLVKSPSITTTTATRLVAPRPFYRSQITPDPFDYSNTSRREADQLQYVQNTPQRRFSVNQINGKTKNILCILHTYDNESFSSKTFSVIQWFDDKL